MLSTRVRSSTTADAGQKISRGVKRGLMDAADAGFAVSQDEVPKDRGTLMQSGIPPEWQGGAVIWGYAADHARPVEEGTGAFTPPLDPLLEWGERVLGSRDAGARAWQSIRTEGIDAQPYVAPGIEVMEVDLRKHGLGPYIDRELD